MKTENRLAMKTTAFCTVWALFLVLAGVACTSETQPDRPLTVREVAESLILRTVADQSNLGNLQPVCPEIPVPAVGTTFACTATANQGEIAISGVINDQGQVELVTTNLITAGALPSFEAAAAKALTDSNPGLALEPEAVDCGENTVVLGEARTVLCVLADPYTNELFDMTLTIDDIETRQFRLVVADAPRAG